MTEHKWINSSPGVISYGDTGFVIRWNQERKQFYWTAPDGRSAWRPSLKTCKIDAENAYEEMREMGLHIA